MTAGRPPKPAQLKILQGTYRPDRASPGEIFPDPVDDLAPPAWLSEPAQEKWNELAPMLSRLGLLTECDLDILALYCSTWVKWQEAERAIQENGSTTRAQSGYQQISPYVTIAKNALADLMRLGDKLGLNPAARNRIHVGAQAEADDLLG
jgi:P27 family predicted phage terminase small subunit